MRRPPARCGRWPPHSSGRDVKLRMINCAGRRREHVRHLCVDEVYPGPAAGRKLESSRKIPTGQHLATESARDDDVSLVRSPLSIEHRHESSGHGHSRREPHPKLLESVVTTVNGARPVREVHRRDHHEGQYASERAVFVHDYGIDTEERARHILQDELLPLLVLGEAGERHVERCEECGERHGFDHLKRLLSGTSGRHESCRDAEDEKHKIPQHNQFSPSQLVTAKIDVISAPSTYQSLALPNTAIHLV